MVDFQVQFVGSEERPPTRKDGVCNLEYANVDFRIGGREATDEFLRQGVPPPPEVRVCDDADSFSELTLNTGRRLDHKTN